MVALRNSRWRRSSERGASGCRPNTSAADWIVAAQSLASTDRIESELLLLEAIAGPVLLVAVFFGTLLIGVKAASPVESARRRQLEFTADASHELRTPLSVIEAEVTLSLAGPRSEEDYRATLGRVCQESLRLRDIVEDLLWLARFDSEPLPPADEPVDVAAIAAACGDRFLAVAQHNEMALLVRDEGKTRPWINAPPEWIDRLTAVLVDNACRYAGPGGTVRIGVTVSGSRVSLMVDDSGPGIAPEDEIQALSPLSPGNRPGQWRGPRSRHRRLGRSGDRWRVERRPGRSGWRAHGGVLAPLAGSKGHGGYEATTGALRVRGHL